MLKTFEAILLLCMSMLLFGLCACSDSGPAPEDLPEPDVKVVESVEKISTNFDTAASQRMAAVIGKNRALMKAARLDYDDVYQQLALRLIKAVAGYDPDKGPLKQHIYAQLQYELFSCGSPRALCGMTDLPRGYDRKNVISICELQEYGELAAA